MIFNENINLRPKIVANQILPRSYNLISILALGNSSPEEYKEMGCAIVAGIEAG